MVPYNPELDVHGNQKVVHLTERARWEVSEIPPGGDFSEPLPGSHCPMIFTLHPSGGRNRTQLKEADTLRPCVFMEFSLHHPKTHFYQQRNSCTLTKENFVLNPQGDVLRVLFVTECERCPGGIQERLLLVITFSIKLPHYQVLPVLL